MKKLIILSLFLMSAQLYSIIIDNKTSVDLTIISDGKEIGTFPPKKEVLIPMGKDFTVRYTDPSTKKVEARFFPSNSDYHQGKFILDKPWFKGKNKKSKLYIDFAEEDPRGGYDRVTIDGAELVSKDAVGTKK